MWRISPRCANATAGVSQIAFFAPCVSAVIEGSKLRSGIEVLTKFERQVLEMRSLVFYAAFFFQAPKMAPIRHNPASG